MVLGSESARSWLRHGFIACPFQLLKASLRGELLVIGPMVGRRPWKRRPTHVGFSADGSLALAKLQTESSP